MNISQEKDKIRDIIRRSSLRNYFSPLIPKQHKARKTEIPKKLEKININLEKLTLKLLIPPKSQTLVKESEHMASKPRYFIQLSSKLLNFPEHKATNPTSSSFLHRSVEVKNVSELVNPVSDKSKINNPILHSIIYENPSQQFHNRHVLNNAKKIKSHSQRNHKDSIKSYHYPTPKPQPAEAPSEGSLDAWESDYFPEYF